MGGPLEPRDRPGDGTDPSQLRISDADRHQVAELLREAAGEGRLDLEELDERLEATYAAKTYADLVPITIDLPVPGEPAAAPVQRRETAPATTSYENSITIMGGVSRKGAWLVPPRHQAFALMGGVDIDLREATFAARETVIYANAVMAGIDIVVDERTHVIVEGVGIMGAFEQSRDKVAPQITSDSPVVRVKGVALMAGVTVTRKGPPRQKKRKLLPGH
jgi:hypothetical protein